MKSLNFLFLMAGFNQTVSRSFTPCNVVCSDVSEERAAPSSASSCRPEDGSSMFLKKARTNTTLHGVKLQKNVLKS